MPRHRCRYQRLLLKLLRQIHGSDSVITRELSVYASAARAEDQVKLLQDRVRHWDALFSSLCFALLQARSDEKVRDMLQ